MAVSASRYQGIENEGMPLSRNRITYSYIRGTFLSVERRMLGYDGLDSCYTLVTAPQT